MSSPKRDAVPPTGPVRRELSVVDRIGSLLERRHGSAPSGELWFGDDAAVLLAPAAGDDIVVCADAAVAGIHVDLSSLGPADLGWRAVATTVSDLAAMGARPRACLVTASVPIGVDVEDVMRGAAAAAAAAHCPIVGGDSTSSATPMVSCTAMGEVPRGTAVRRSGAAPGNRLYLTGPLGGAAAGLRALRAGARRDDEVVERHRRPVPLLDEGWVARDAGATAMIDISDGFGIDLDRLCRASGVGVQLTTLPVVAGATMDEAIGGGDDYELLIAAPAEADVAGAFRAASLRPLLEIGCVVEDRSARRLDGVDIPATGYEHPLG